MPSDGHQNTPLFPLSRRRFLQGVSAGTAAVAVAPELARAQLQLDEEATGEARVPIRLKVNGRTFRVNVEPRWTLLDVLRNQLDLTGTKRVCDRGECGACTVRVDGQTAYSCLLLALDVQEREITTIEGLSASGRLHPVQEAFVRNDALQCGFCTPGMVMACTALLEKNPEPSLEDIKAGLSGNLCKCGTYPKIFRAVREAAQMMKKGS